MKEIYFTSSSIRVKSEQLRVATVQRDSTQHTLLPNKSALLILDMQEYFLDKSSHAFIPSAEAIIPGLVKLVKAFRAHNYLVIFTRHLNTPENAGQMDKWWDDTITAESPLSVISEEFDTSKSTLIEKSQYDAFHNTDLEDELRKQGVTQLVIGGVMTHLCCETTARAAFVHGFEVFFPVDGTATYNEQFHKATLLNLSHGFATIPTVDELIEEFSDEK